MKITYFIPILILISSCNPKNGNNEIDQTVFKTNQPKQSQSKKMNDKELIENVKLAINPKFPDWVLFKNGTYIIFDDITKVKNINDEAMVMMKEFGPVFAGGPAGDFNTIHLTKTEGWIVSGHGYGMYTYVSPSEIQNESANDMEIGLLGRSKRDLDGKKPEIIYVNKSK
ncbi:hypothetical protein LPB85_07650 [Chryseobacterium sp. LC2016-27]|uniref:hypothetical protein n=1 Tax=Chryseobacterium sp. LC2016-27 TaxID=2897326 RepID=UPI001E4EBAAE|nr:hypothetical protein [Chryseobacterium sp. LC2016-27]MCD0455320.1 hypothetical protein [Chryseobacterium sp. LC2016-27]